MGATHKDVPEPLLYTHKSSDVLRWSVLARMEEGMKTYLFLGISDTEHWWVLTAKGRYGLCN